MPRGCLGHVLQEGVCFTDFSLRVDAFRNPGDPGSENHLLDVQKPVHTVDGQNPAPPRMIFIGVLTIPGGAGFLPSRV